MISLKKKSTLEVVFGVTAFIILLMIGSHFLSKRSLQEKYIAAVITSFNNAPWVEKNLDSIFAQDYKNFHIFYIDDCSTDGTADKVQEYIQKRNLENYLTLIKNETRSVKMLNLYKIYHQLDDWALVAQIDGDDWLENKHVFKTINEAYAKDIWLAYTQFSMTTGGKGSNAVPPAWVQWQGAFRKYKSTWFMYSHLKTFYAWLFKQIKLQDFIDDATGKFLPSNDDVLMMYPMLEMARNNFSFIPKSCYVWNVSPGFRPELRLQSNPDFQEQFFKKPAYQAFEKNLLKKMNQGDYKVDIILLALRGGADIEQCIDALKKNVSGFTKIIVLTHKLEHVQAIKQDDTISVALLDSYNIGKNQLSDYFLIIDDEYAFSEKISLQEWAQELEKTKADAFYCKQAQELSSCYQPLYNSLCAWKYGFKKSEDIDLSNYFGLYRKQAADDIVQKIVYNKELYNHDNSVVGLAYEKPLLKKIEHI
ncbi:MAG: glycosyltransferase family 2 protein [Candidatus Babeliales bacterium]